MENKSIYTVTIGIPAYNEEANITNLLNSILRQKEDGYLIERIIVLSDASTDKTVEKVEEIKDPRIEILDFKKRMGKSYHLNTFPKIVNSDILALFDADVVLNGEDVIKKLIEPIIKEENVGLVSGNFLPIRVKNFFQHAVKTTINVYEVLRQEWKGGHNAFGCTGRIQALSKPFYKVLKVPPTMVLNDIYTYFDCIQNGFEFRHVKSVNVYYQLPTNLKDYLNQFKRFCVGSSRMSKIFQDLYTQEYSISKKRFYLLMLKQFTNKTIHCIFICFVNIIGKFMATRELKKMDGKWEVVTSTKNLNN